MATRDLPLRSRLVDRAVSARRAILRRRRALAVLCTVAAVAAGLRATAPPEPPTAAVVVAARDLAAGTALEGDDLRVAALPPDAVPGGALTDLGDVVGAVLAAPVRGGEPVTDVRLVGPDLTATAPGTTAVPVRLSDSAQARLLTVGDRIDLLATEPEARTTATVATGALVLAVPDPGPDSSDAIAGRLVVLGVPGYEVSQVTAAGVTAFVTYAWSSR